MPYDLFNLQIKIKKDDKEEEAENCFAAFYKAAHNECD